MAAITGTQCHHSPSTSVIMADTTRAETSMLGLFTASLPKSRLAIGFERRMRCIHSDSIASASAMSRECPTTYSVSCYRKDTPTVGELDLFTSKLAEAQREAQRLKGLPHIARVEIEIDPGTDDTFPKRAERLVSSVRKAMEEGKTECNYFVQAVLQNYDENKKLAGKAEPR